MPRWREAILQACETFGGGAILIRQDIPTAKLGSARQALSIPRSEEVLGLVDNTIFGLNQGSMAFALNGLYWRNGPMRGPSFLRWSDLRSLQFTPRRSFPKALLMNEMKISLVAADLQPDALAELLQCLKLNLFGMPRL